MTKAEEAGLKAYRTKDPADIADWLRQSWLVAEASEPKDRLLELAPAVLFTLAHLVGNPAAVRGAHAR